MRLLLALTFILFTNSVNSQNRTDGPVTIPMVLTEEGHTMVQATVHGVEGNFIFDTGAGLNMLTKNFSVTISDLEETDSFYTGHRATGEKLQLDLWRTGQVEVGSYTLKDELFSVYDIDFPLAGLLSLSIFKDVPITIDYENELLIAESGESLEERIDRADAVIPIQILANRGRAWSIFVHIHLNNQLKLQVKLDSGAGFDVYRFNARYMEPLGIDSSRVDHEYKRSDFVPEEGNNYYYTQIPEMSTLNGEAGVRDFEATFIEGLIYEGIMGINWLGDQITVDIPNERLIVKKSN